ncbi:MAG: hypothetical protein AB8E15_11145 [Bdellovibrionales bacterium]
MKNSFIIYGLFTFWISLTVGAQTSDCAKELVSKGYFDDLTETRNQVAERMCDGISKKVMFCATDMSVGDYIRGVSPAISLTSSIRECKLRSYLNNSPSSWAEINIRNEYANRPYWWAKYRQINIFDKSDDCSRLSHDMKYKVIPEKSIIQKEAAKQSFDKCLEILDSTNNLESTVSCIVNTHLTHGDYPVSKYPIRCHYLVKDYIYNIIKIIFGDSKDENFVENVTKELFKY